MDLKEKLMKLEELMDLEEGSLHAEEQLSEIEEWDSITHLSLIILLEDDYDKEISGEEVRALKTVQDILNLMR
jgi:Phosphopantetheine attachment site.